MDKIKSRLYAKMLLLTLLPIVILGAVITMFSVHTFSKGMHVEVQEGMRNVCISLVDSYEREYPGEYGLAEEDGRMVLLKGGKNLSGLLETFDAVRAATEIDLTVFYGNVRMLTTVRDEAGSRLHGTKADERIAQDVLQNGQEHFYDSAKVGEVNYFAYYMPLFNGEECVGMIFAGRPLASVERLVNRAAGLIVLIAFAAMLLTAIVCIRFMNNIVEVLNKIMKFWGGLAIGNFSAELDPAILERHDEIGNMGRMTEHVQKSLRFMVEYDSLTKLYNRGTIELRLDHVIVDAQNKGKVFSVAIADIDFFKKVNDAYGHECGDVVLKETAAIMAKHMDGKGYIGRWGGEEFLLIYEKRDKQQTAEELEELFWAIRNNMVAYEDHTIHITITAGVAEYNRSTGNTKLALLREADDKLYVGKASGRNQYVL